MVAVASPTSPTLSQLSRAPSYADSQHPPSYGGDAAGRAPGRESARKIVARQNDLATVVLPDVEVEEDTGRPTYGLGMVVHGQVELGSLSDVTSVTARLDGRFKVRLGELTSTHQTFVDVPQTLGTASKVLPFSLAFPETFTDRDDALSYPLPPSLDFRDKTGDQDELRLRVVYRLLITVGRGPLHLQKTIEIELTYVPREPQNWHMPSGAARPNFAETKETPLGWHCAAVQVPAAPPSKIAPVDSAFYIPAVDTFSIHDRIPFALVLRAPSTSMRELFVPTVPPKLRKQQKSEHFPPPSIRVWIKRQIVCSIQAITVAHSFTVGEGTLTMGTPKPTTPGEAQVAYEGEIQCNEGTKYASFASGKIAVSDYLVLSIAPHNPYFSEFAALNHTIPIKTVAG